MWELFKYSGHTFIVVRNYLRVTLVTSYHGHGDEDDGVSHLADNVKDPVDFLV